MILYVGNLYLPYPRKWRIAIFSRIVFTAFLATIVATAALPALADETFSITGDDAFQIGAQTASHISYTGTERLRVLKEAHSLRFLVTTTYIRTQKSSQAPARAFFAQDLLSDGTFEDKQNDDPDSLTVLNQPFSIMLDPITLNDLESLKGSVPFEAASAIVGGTLRGSLRRGPSGLISKTSVIGVRFEATGPMRGPLPGHAEIAIDGAMHMDGMAYYSVKNAMLVALTANLTITGTLHDSSVATPVHIVYTRSIREL